MNHVAPTKELFPYLTDFVSYLKFQFRHRFKPHKRDTKTISPRYELVSRKTMQKITDSWQYKSSKRYVPKNKVNQSRF